MSELRFPMRPRLCQLGLVLATFVLLAIASQFACGQMREESQPPVLTIDAAIAAARTSNSDNRVRTLDSEKAEQAISLAKTSRYPQFNLYTNAGYLLKPLTFTIPKGTLGSYPGTGPIPSQDASITTPRDFTALIYGSAAQPLTQLNKIRLAVQDARLGLLLAQQAERDQRIHTVDQVKAAYFELVTTQSQIDSAENSLTYMGRLETEVDANLAQQTALKADSLAVRAKLVQQRYRLLTLRDTLQTQKEGLNRLLGKDISTQFRVEMQPAPAPEELDLVFARRTALAQRPEVQEAKLQTKRALLAIRRERANYLPDISLQFNYLSAPNISFLPHNAASAGLLLQWQPFDWGEKHFQTEELKASSQQARMREDDARQQVLLDVGATFRKLQETRALLDAQASVTDAEEEKLRELMNRYEQKTVLLSDVLQQQSTVAQALADREQDVASLWTSRADFERSLGEQ